MDYIKKALYVASDVLVSNEKVKKIEFDIPKYVYDALNKEKEKYGVSLDAVVNALVRIGIEKKTKMTIR
jgi:Zn-dependent peptidase ImmA (M78 family)